MADSILPELVSGLIGVIGTLGGVALTKSYERQAAKENAIQSVIQAASACQRRLEDIAEQLSHHRIKVADDEKYHLGSECNRYGDAITAIWRSSSFTAHQEAHRLVRSVLKTPAYASLNDPEDLQRCRDEISAAITQIKAATALLK